MYGFTEIIEDTNSPYYGLRRDIAHKLLNLDICSKEQVLSMIKDGKMHPSNPSMKNFGWRSYVECCTWVGLPEPDKNRRMVICPHCGKALP